ncbi:MAG: hypothetical protein NT001_00025 [Candidatus Woesearchaeota archaeon]|nr:hypothetical protein [Candidatus Woesearchaeota archaeon]
MKKKSAGNVADSETAKALSKIDSQNILDVLIDHLKSEHKLSEKEISKFISGKLQEKISLPVSVLGDSKLSPLEAVVKYLKEEKKLSYHQIAEALKRDDRTIWLTYSNACKKRADKLEIKKSRFFIPVSILSDRKLSILESVVVHLKEEFELSFSEIASILNRDQRNIWTAHSRALKKRKAKT